MTKEQKIALIEQLAKKEQAATESQESSSEPATEASKPRSAAINPDALHAKIHKDLKEHYRHTKAVIQTEVDRSFQELKEEIQELKEETANLATIRKNVEMVKWLAYNAVIIVAIIVLLGR